MTDQKNANLTSPGDSGTRTADEIDPDELMGEISSISFLKTAGISLLIHTVVIALTSIGFLMLCSEHGTWYPDRKLQEIAREKRLEKLREDREEAQAQLMADRKAAKDKQPDGTKDASGKNGKKPNGNGDNTGPKGKTPGVKDRSKVKLDDVTGYGPP